MVIKDKIPPCDICNTKYNKEMVKIANIFFQDDNPCYCNQIKKIEKLIIKNNRLKERIIDLENSIYEHSERNI